MNLLLLPIKRPVAVAMFFLGIVLLGAIASQRLAVELFPALQGDMLFVNFGRPGSDPEVVERELLIPLQTRVATLAGVQETWAEITGSNGNFRVQFERGTNIKTRELELQRYAADIRRSQPQNTYINVGSQNTGVLSTVVMQIQVTGKTEDKNALFDLAEQIVSPRLAALSGVSQVIVNGGAGKQVTVKVDADRATALGITTSEVTNAVKRNVGRSVFVGGLESEAGRTAVILDGRPNSAWAVEEARISDKNSAVLRHVAQVDVGFGREERLFRVNGQPAVGLVVFQQQGSNLVRLGARLRDRIDVISEELQPMGIGLVVGFDAAETVEDQISRLSELGLSGFLIALLVLYFFLRQWRAVLVVGLAVPVSLLAALAALYLLDQSLNLITLFGLALAIGLVIDNSVVVFEAIQRQVEHGLAIDEAVREGLKRTARAIIAASATTAVVFVPLAMLNLDDAMIQEMAQVISLSILLPLFASLLIAIGLVPLLAFKLAGPAAAARREDLHQRREARGNLIPPDVPRMLFTRIVAGALRHPPTWITGTMIAVLLTVAIALPWVMVNSRSQEAAEADTLQLEIQFASARGSLNTASQSIARLEQTALDLEGVETVEAQIREEGGTLTVHLVDEELRPEGFRAQVVRNKLREEGKKIKGLEILRPGQQGRGNDGGGGGLGGGNAFGGSPAEIVISGPDSGQLQSLADTIQSQLDSMEQVSWARVTVRPGSAEFWIEPMYSAFVALGLNFNDILPTLNLAGREGETMQTGFVTGSGRELPLVIERVGARDETGARADLSRLRLQTPAGVVPVASLATIRQMPAPPVIAHHNGRREISVMYGLSDQIPETGPTRILIEEQIADAVRAIPKPQGVSIETLEENDAVSLLEQILVPAVLLLFLILAMTFESMSLPVLVLVALPLTLLGATWALAFAAMPLGPMAAMGALALIGLTVNPAILLLDRMQQLIRNGGWSPGAAALAAVRERTRPVLMTTATTVAGLWPLAIVTGQENEIWPPFATIVMGGLVTSTLLTLMIMPVGFILLRRVDVLFARVGPWLAFVWLTAMVGTMSALILTEVLTSLLWQIVSALIIGGIYLAIAVLVFSPRKIPEPDCNDGPPTLEVKYLQKVYGLPGPFSTALQAPRRFAKKVLESGHTAFHPADARENLVPLMLAASGFGYLAYLLSSSFWTLVFAMVSTILVIRTLLEVRRMRGLADATGQVLPGGPENMAASLLPWLTLAGFTIWYTILPLMDRPADQQNTPVIAFLILPVIATLLTLTIVRMRQTAQREQEGSLPPLEDGWLRSMRAGWRKVSNILAGQDLPTEPVYALNNIHFRIERGMIGILGPNGAGKTTLLRQLAGILDPTRGTISLGGVPMDAIKHHLANWVGYLPQYIGLPQGMSPKEYLHWYAELYGLSADIRHERVNSLLTEVGLEAKVDDTISSLSGGMKQRVAIARTLLRLPPVIIVDEPTSGLDPRERIRFRNLLSRLARDRIVLFSTHVVEDVAVACDRVMVLGGGRLHFDGPTGDLANVANGRVWEIVCNRGELPRLPADAMQTEELPTPQGKIAYRILSGEQPHETANKVDATLEDGYLWLIASRGWNFDLEEIHA